MGLSMWIKKKKKHFWDFPGGPVLKNTPANAGDTGLIPGPMRSSVCAPQQEETLQWEACITQMKSSLCSLQLEKDFQQQQRPRVAKNKHK